MSPARLLVVLLFVFVVLSVNNLYPIGRAMAADTSSPSAKPTRCWIYDKLYPATTKAFKSQRLTRAQQQEVQKWTAAVSAVDRPRVRWMRDPHDESQIFVMVPDSEQIWTVLNEQFIVNHVDCWIRGDMAPRIYPSGTYSPG